MSAIRLGGQTGGVSSGTIASSVPYTAFTGSDFHDITTGDNLTLGPVNYEYHAGPGWDPVTGWGSPNAQMLIPLLGHSKT